MKYEDVLDLLRNEPTLYDVPVIALNPQSLQDVLEDVQRVADAAQVSDAGSREVALLKSRIDAVQSKTVGIQSSERPRVACIEWTDPLMLAANWMPEMIELAGGRQSLRKRESTADILPGKTC